MSTLVEELGLIFVDPPPPFVGKTGQRQCRICGLFMKRFIISGRDEWMCVRYQYIDYYGSWEHE